MSSHDRGDEEWRDRQSSREWHHEEEAEQRGLSLQDDFAYERGRRRDDDNDEDGNDQEDDGPDSYSSRLHCGFPKSVAVMDKQGYPLADDDGALSDGPSSQQGGFDGGGGKSSESVGSQGSAEPSLNYYRHVMNGETRFPTAFAYATSETAKSDIATVCSGSVFEDIEVASVQSAEYNNNTNTHAAAVATGVAAVLPSAKSSNRKAVEFIDNFSKQHQQPQHDMGPPLARALLLQYSQQQQESSRPGSVKSFGSTVGEVSSDVVATDDYDYGGSFMDEGHSVHSQDDNVMRASEEGTEPRDDNDDDDHDVTKARIADNTSAAVSVPNNGRVSPGGTVYRGKGPRRYKGRYMHLALKRFHQNGVSLGVDDNSSAPIAVHEYDDRRSYHRQQQQQQQQQGHRHPLPPQFNRDDRRSDWWSSSGHNHRPRRSRSRSRSPPPSRGYYNNGRGSSSGGRSSRESPTRHSYSSRRERYARGGSNSNEESPSRHFNSRRRQRSNAGSSSR